MLRHTIQLDGYNPALKESSPDTVQWSQPSCPRKARDPVDHQKDCLKDGSCPLGCHSLRADAHTPTGRPNWVIQMYGASATLSAPSHHRVPLRRDWSPLETQFGWSRAMKRFTVSGRGGSVASRELPLKLPQGYNDDSRDNMADQVNAGSISASSR